MKENDEIWKTIEGYKDLYMVSNLGNVRSLIYNKLLKPRITRHGYINAMLYKYGIAKSYAVHRLVASAFCDRRLFTTEVNHKNGIKYDNRAENLEWMTHQENSQYSFDCLDATERRKNLSLAKQGSKHPNSKLNEDTVKLIKEIKEFYPNYTDKEIGKRFGVHRKTINDILTHRTWIHVN